MTFKFTLQRIFEIRESALKDAEIAFENAKTIKESLQRMLYEERDAYFSEREELNGYIQKAQFDMLKLFESSLETRKKRMLEVLEALKIANGDLDVAENNLFVSKRDLKVVEKLKENQLADYLATLAEKERKFLDEQATLRRGREAFLELKRGA